jgi:hypothetical protein
MIERRRYTPHDDEDEDEDLDSEGFDYAGLKALAKRLARPVTTLLALSPTNDPFYADVPARRQMAEWFAGLWRRHSLATCKHLRAMFYRLISQEKKKPQLPDGTPFENVYEQWVKLIHASRDARHLGLVPDNWEDRKGTAIINMVEPAPAIIEVTNGNAYDWDLAAQPALPTFVGAPPTPRQRYHLETWCEKSTMNDILVELGERYQMNVVTGEGEISLTQCVNLVERAIQSGLPVRILYLSDFDPKGDDMPVSVARKIEHVLHRRGLHLDIQVRKVALTHDQCLQYDLPRTPIKDSEKAKGDFEQRYGEGATELDALEAIHPGVLRTILVAEIERYFDPGLAQATETAAAELTEQLEAIIESVHAEHRNEITQLNTRWAEIAAMIEAWKEQAETVYQDIANSLDERKPDPNDHEWPEAREADEDDDPLFDSTRDYVEQIDRYKEHQDKPTERRG